MEMPALRMVARQFRSSQSSLAEGDIAECFNRIAELDPVAYAGRIPVDSRLFLWFGIVPGAANSR